MDIHKKSRIDRIASDISAALNIERLHHLVELSPGEKELLFLMLKDEYKWRINWIC